MSKFPSTVPGDHSMVLHAARKAAGWHHGQIRKYTGEPYIVHPLAVAGLVANHTMDPHVMCAAVLHDVLEDCPSVMPEDIFSEFGYRVADMVQALTDTPVGYLDTYGKSMNRAARKAADRERIAKAGPEVQLIKACDMYDNSRTIRQFDLKFWPVFLAEKKAMLAVMRDLDPHWKLKLQGSLK